MPLTRRTLLASVPAAAATAALPAAASVGEDMLTRIRAVIAQLSEEERRAVGFPFGGRQMAGWNYMRGTRVAPGLPMERMSGGQKEAARALLASALSAQGFEKAENIMLQQDILWDEWRKGSADRNRERFSLMIFGNPTATDPWAWRWEGHHLTMTFSLIGTEVVSITPNAFASEPNTVPSGPHRGLVVLDEEEVLGRALYQSLDAGQRRAALISEASFGNVRATAGREAQFRGLREGVALGDLRPDQAELALRLVEVYTAEPFARELAGARRARQAEVDPMATRFAWSGADLNGSITYRLQNDAVLIEFATLRNQPLHLHTIVHDLDQNFGAHRI